MSQVTALDVRDAKYWIESRWGPDRAWSDWESHVAQFSGFTVGALKEALNAWYKRGIGKGPKPDQLYKLVSEVQLLRIERGTDQVERKCQGNHVWADPWPTDKDRHRVCVLCGETGPLASCQHVFTPDGLCFYCPAKAAV